MLAPSLHGSRAILIHWVALLALITAGLLQILSNLANDYGDAVKGSDKPDRIGPLRGCRKGVITPSR